MMKRSWTLRFEPLPLGREYACHPHGRIKRAHRVQVQICADIIGSLNGTIQDHTQVGSARSSPPHPAQWQGHTPDLARRRHRKFRDAHDPQHDHRGCRKLRVLTALAVIPVQVRRESMFSETEVKEIERGALKSQSSSTARNRCIAREACRWTQK